MRAVLLLALLCASPSACTPRVPSAASGGEGAPAPGSAVWPSRQIPAGELVGVVVDARSRGGVRAARVWLESGAAAVTDSLGLFRLTGVAPGAATLRATGLGYASVRLDAELAEGSGHAAVILTPPAPVALCAIWTEPPNAVVVRVRDVRTAAPPTVPVTVVVRDGSFADSATTVMDARALNPEHIGVGPARAGRYTVRVRAPGFQPWSGRAHAQRQRGPCGNDFHSGSLDAWLVPR